MIIKKLFILVVYVLNRLTLKKQNVTYGTNLTINGLLYVRNRGEFTIGDNVTINSGDRYSPIGGFSKTRFIVNGSLSIGNGVGISNSNFYVDRSIKIGNDTLIGASCNFLDTDFHSTDYKDRISGNDFASSEPISIGKGAFVGAHSIILKGAKIRDYQIIPAGSRVLRDGKVK